jgi:hypothetical protein
VVPRFSTPLNIGIAIGFYRMATSWQGEDFMKHRAGGGARRSNWAVFGIIVATFAVVIAAVTGIVIASEGREPADYPGV